MKRCQLKDVATFDPVFRPNGYIGPNATASFVPMSAVCEQTGRIITPQTREISELTSGYTYFQNGDILIAKITPCFENGKMAIVNLPSEHAFGSTEFHVVRPDASVLTNRFLFHYLRQEWVRKEGERKMTGSAGQRRLPRYYLGQLAVPLPPLAEQRRIAAILDAADALREKRRQALAKLDGLVQAVFLEMFGDPKANPQKWIATTLGEVVADGPQNGIYKPASEYGDGTLILRIDAFYDGVITGRNSLKRVKVSDQERQLYSLHEGDIVINRVNSREYLGKSALVPCLEVPIIFESNMMRLGLDKSRVEPGFLIQLLQTRFIKDQIAVSAKDAVNQSSINQQDVKKFQIILPPLTTQRQFWVSSSRINRERSLYIKSIARLDALFTSLQQRAFRGEL